MKGIYLAAGKATHPGYDIVYQDILGNRDIPGDMLDVDLSKYDFVIATPPCNYWSICNYRRESSKYALATKHLLPGILKKLVDLDIPFIVENVRNFPLMDKNHLFDFPVHVYFVGRHTYWTNVMLCTDVPQRFDFNYGGKILKYPDMDSSYHQGGYNVEKVINVFLDTIGA